MKLNPSKTIQFQLVIRKYLNAKKGGTFIAVVGILSKRQTKCSPPNSKGKTLKKWVKSSRTFFSLFVSDKRKVLINATFEVRNCFFIVVRRNCLASIYGEKVVFSLHFLPLRHFFHSCIAQRESLCTPFFREENLTTPRGALGFQRGLSINFWVETV